MMPFAAFADNAIVCPACGGEVTKKPYHLVGNYWDFYKCNTCGKWAYLSGVAGLKLLSAGDQAIINAADANAILNFAFNNGHLIPAEKAPSGIGRKDLPGYENSDTNPGVPSISQDGNIALLAKYRFTNNQNQLVDSFSKQVDNDIWNFGENSLYIERYSNSSTKCYTYCGYILDTHNVPGIYYVPAGTSYVFNPWGDGNVRNLNGKKWPENTSLYVGSSSSDGSKRYLCIYRYNADKTYDSYRYPEMHWSIGDGTDNIFRQDSGYSISTSGNITIPYPKDLVVYLRPTSTNIVKNTNITINNNTWNGNIYTDNSTNLTYIYPQYTTINEKNETVTNISNTPIIYNNETKKYYTYDIITNNYYYITYEQPTTPTPSPNPKPTWKPGGGSTRGGGTGRYPADPFTADWTLNYYILNNRRYDAYYALKRTEVDTKNNIPWIDDKHYISTTQIPIANGEYTISVPDGVYWRVWQWDEASKTLTGVNSSNWHGNNFTFLFNTTDEYIFEFCKSDGSEFSSPKDVVLKLKNEKITEYEPGDTIVDDTIHPETQNLIIPKMNSNTFTDEHGTWVASGSSKYSDVFDFFYAFDRSTSNFWETNVSPSHLQIEIPDPESYYIDGYIMRISKFNNRYAKEWTLQGSDDSKTWDDLDKQAGQNLSDLEEHKYPLTLRKAYKYYRLNTSNYASSMCSLSHFNLLGYDAKDVVTPTPAPTNPPTPTTPPTPGGDNPGGSGSGDNSWNPFKWLTDLLKDIVETILKGLWKLLTSIFGFILWLLSLLFKLFPWMPNSGILALCAGVVVVTVIRIIKFITGR
jgi:hypothetical protein